MKEGEKNVGAIFESLQIYRGEDCYAADGQHVSVCCGGGIHTALYAVRHLWQSISEEKSFFI